MIKVSAPGKIHLLGEHSVVYGKPAIIAAVDLRLTVTLSSVIASDQRERGNLPTLEDSSLITQNDKLKEIFEPIIKKHLKIKTIPPYKIDLSSDIPQGAGLGSSAALSVSYIGALLTFLKVDWNPSLVNDLAYEAEMIFNGNPAGGDNSTVCFGGLIWFRKESPDLKIVQHLNFSVPTKLSKNFVLINTGTPKETTRQLVEQVKKLSETKPKVVQTFLENQEKLVKELLPVIKNADETGLIRIIRQGEKNLESIGVVSTYVKSIIRKIEQAGGAGKICGAGGKTKATGILLCYHPNPSIIKNIAKSFALDYIQTSLGVEGLRQE